MGSRMDLGALSNVAAQRQAVTACRLRRGQARELPQQPGRRGCCPQSLLADGRPSRTSFESDPRPSAAGDDLPGRRGRAGPSARQNVAGLVATGHSSARRSLSGVAGIRDSAHGVGPVRRADGVVSGDGKGRQDRPPCQYIRCSGPSSPTVTDHPATSSRAGRVFVSTSTRPPCGHDASR